MDHREGARARLAAIGDEMVLVHTWLRKELARLDTDLGEAPAGERLRDLRAHCLSFCSALGRHHTGEERGAFPLLAERFPELRTVLEKLEEDHVQVNALLRGLERLVDDIPAEPDAATAARVRAEIGGLAAILESHFSFEERRIVDALNSLPPDAGEAEELLGVTAPRS